MATPAAAYPFTAFNFAVAIIREGESKALCEAAFSDCDGLEMTMEVKTIREGGNNSRQIRLAGPAAYGQLTLKRGMTDNFDLWTWFADSIADSALRTTIQVTLLASDGTTERARFQLDRCVPVKIKAPAMSAKDGAVAIEELQIAYEEMTVVPSSPRTAG